MNPKGDSFSEPAGRGVDHNPNLTKPYAQKGGTSLFGSTTKQRLLRGAGLVVVIALAVYGFQELQPAAKPKAPPATPVSAEKVVRRDVPIYRFGYGTARANNTVVLKARVDGTLDKIMFTEGQEVKAGDIIAQIDPRPYQAALDSALAKKAQDEATLIKAKSDLTRYQALTKSQYSSQQTLEAQVAAVAQGEATLQGDVAQIDNARVQLGYTTIRAPLTGRIGLRQVDVGNILHATDQTGLAVISQVHPISVIFSLSATELTAVTKGLAIHPLPVTAYSSDDKDKLADGELLTLDNSVDEASGTIKLKAVFSNEGNQLWPGQTVSAHVLVDTHKAALTVPARAVQRGPNGLYVYVVQPDSKVAVRAVETSETSGDAIIVVSDTLAEGDTVVTDGQSRLEPGARVTLRNASGDAKVKPAKAASSDDASPKAAVAQ